MYKRQDSDLYSGRRRGLHQYLDTVDDGSSLQPEKDSDESELERTTAC